MISLYTPKIEELSFRQALLADPATMAYNARWGGCIDFPQKKWTDWYDRWIVNTQGKRFYAYLYNGEEKCFVGEAACHLDEESGRYLLNVLVHDRFRGRGYGTGNFYRRLLCFEPLQPRIPPQHLVVQNQHQQMPRLSEKAPQRDSRR